MTLFPILLNQAGGEYMEAVLVTEWMKAPGDPVRKGELLVTVETAKAATEIVAECSGWLAVIHVPEGQETPLGVPLGHITDTEGESAERASENPQDITPQKPRIDPPAKRTRVRASPYARRLARERGVALATIKSTGSKGRIKARDLPERGPEDLSSDPPLVLLHGFGGDRTAWHGLRAILPERVIALDLACHGERVDRPADSLSGMADDVASQLDALGIEDIHLVGHSLGGAVAVVLAASGMISVRSLVLIAPAGLAGAVSRAFTQAFLNAEGEADMRSAFEWLVADAANLPAGLASATLQRMDTGSARAVLTTLEHDLFADRANFDQSAAMDRLPIPIRLIRGTADRVIPWPPDTILPGHVALHLLEGVGHMPQLERPELVSRLILETRRSAP